MKTIKLICTECGGECEKLLKEYKRSLKVGRKIFCSLKCASRHNLNARKMKGEQFCCPADKQGLGGRHKTEMSKYKPLLHLVHQRKNEKVIELTLNDIRDIWESQNGLCAYTRIKLELPQWDVKKKINTASVDRIDSTKGYIKENCQIVSVMANFAKNTFTDSDMKEFCRQIAVNFK